MQSDKKPMFGFLKRFMFDDTFLNVVMGIATIVVGVVIWAVIIEAGNYPFKIAVCAEKNMTYDTVEGLGSLCIDKEGQLFVFLDKDWARYKQLKLEDEQRID